MPKLIQKLKVHLLLHIVHCMSYFSPSSAFSAERETTSYVDISICFITGTSHLIQLLGYLVTVVLQAKTSQVTFQ